MIALSKFEQDMLENLNKNTKILINSLNNLSFLNFNPNIDLIDFEIFIEPTRFEIDIMMFSMDKEGNEVFNENNNQEYFAGSRQIASEIKFYSDDSILEDEELFEKAFVIAEKVIFEWFVSCWNQSTCNKVILPIYVGMHDCINSFDLQNSRWIDMSDKFILQ